MLPFAAGGTTQEIGGTRFDADRQSLPSIASLASKSQNTRRQERDGDNVFEHRLIAVPSDARTFCVFRHEDLLQGIGRNGGEGGGLVSQGQQEVGDGVALPQRSSRIVISPSIGDDASLTKVAMEFKRSERQRPNCSTSACSAAREITPSL